MKSDNLRLKKFKYMQSKKVNGGVGVKKQSIWATPIRLSTVSRNFNGDYTGTSSVEDNKHLNSRESNIFLYTKEKSRAIRPEMRISMKVDLSTPKGYTRNVPIKSVNVENSITSQWGNTVLNLINNQQKSKTKESTSENKQSNPMYYEMTQKNPRPVPSSGIKIYDKSLAKLSYRQKVQASKAVPDMSKDASISRCLVPKSMSSK